jgi:hypothetical protein
MKRLAVFGLGLLLLGSAAYHLTAQEKEPPKARVIPTPDFQLKGSEQANPPGFGQPGPGGRTFVQPASPYKDLVPALIESLKDSDPEVRQAAAATLAHVGREAVAPLVEVLKDKDRQIRANAAYVLGQIGTPAQEAVPALTKVLKDEDKEVRRRAAFALYLVVRHSQETGSMMAPGMPGMPGAPTGFGGMAPGVGGRGPRTARLNVNDPGLLLGTDGTLAPPADKGKPDKQ